MQCLSVSVCVCVAAHSDVNLWSLPFHQLGKFFYFIADSCELAHCVRADAQDTHTHPHRHTGSCPHCAQECTDYNVTHTHMLRHINICCCSLFKQSLSTNILVSCLLLFLIFFSFFCLLFFFCFSRIFCLFGLSACLGQATPRCPTFARTQAGEENLRN